MTPFSFNIGGKLHEYGTPIVMGILNATPDSFYGESRAQNHDAVMQRVKEMVDEGADIIDVGAYSARPGCADIDPDEEKRRLEKALEAVKEAAPDIPVSVDTFRAEVAKYAVKELGADIINDISGGILDTKMLETVASLQVPYVMMHMRGNPQTMTRQTDYDNLLLDIITDLAPQVQKANLLGINDLIIDPGFGFSKTLEQNYLILKHLELFEVFHAPILVGISRKSMITKLLDITADEALPSTSALNMYALQKGASILRVHDVAAAKQAIQLHCHLI